MEAGVVPKANVGAGVDVDVPKPLPNDISGDFAILINRRLKQQQRVASSTTVRETATWPSHVWQESCSKNLLRSERSTRLSRPIGTRESLLPATAIGPVELDSAPTRRFYERIWRGREISVSAEDLRDATNSPKYGAGAWLCCIDYRSLKKNVWTTRYWFSSFFTTIPYFWFRIYTMYFNIYIRNVHTLYMYIKLYTHFSLERLLIAFNRTNIIMYMHRKVYIECKLWDI